MLTNCAKVVKLCLRDPVRIQWTGECIGDSQAIGQRGGHIQTLTATLTNGRLLTGKGVMRLFVYGEPARRGILDVHHALRLSQSSRGIVGAARFSPHEIDVARAYLSNLPDSSSFASLLFNCRTPEIQYTLL